MHDDPQASNQSKNVEQGDVIGLEVVERQYD
jgi:hypothetical protein